MRRRSARLKSLAAEAQKSFPDAAPFARGGRVAVAGVVRRGRGRPRNAARDRRALCQAALASWWRRAPEGAKLAASIGERIAAMRRRIEEVAPLVRNRSPPTSSRRAAARGARTADDDRVRASWRCSPPRSTSTRSWSACARTSPSRAHARAGRGGRQAARLRRPGAQSRGQHARLEGGEPAAVRCALELKLLVEQVREQVQNIE